MYFVKNKDLTPCPSPSQGETQTSEALKIFSDDPDKFDLAIIEPVMPGMGGIDLAVRLRDIRSDFPVMLYSGYAAALLIQTTKNLGLGPIVSKPLSLEELGKAVIETIDRS